MSRQLYSVKTNARVEDCPNKSYLSAEKLFFADYWVNSQAILMEFCKKLFSRKVKCSKKYCIGETVDGAPVWHFVSRWGAGCCLLTTEIQTKWPPFILFLPARFEFSFFYIFLTRPWKLENWLTVAAIHFLTSQIDCTPLDSQMRVCRHHTGASPGFLIVFSVPPNIDLIFEIKHFEDTYGYS